VLVFASEDCKVFEAQIRRAVVSAIKGKSLLLPRPSELSEDTVVLFDKNRLR
jgi:hypothetical protein